MRMSILNNIENTVERHYWRAVTFLVILILAGAAFWGRTAVRARNVPRKTRSDRRPERCASAKWNKRCNTEQTETP